MRIRLLIFIGCFSTINFVSAQFVAIPDSGFRAFLNMRYPTCFNASMMLDTTCSRIVNDTSFIVSQFGVKSVEGLMYFKNITSFTLKINQVSSISSFPPKLKDIYIEGNPLTSLPPLPAGLKRLECTTGALASLPKLPEGLIFLNIDENEVAQLPELPSSLSALYCGANQLGSLPALPQSMIELMCHQNNITSLPELPSNLQKLTCMDNPLVCLPHLPTGLGPFLYYDHDLIKCLPNLTVGLDPNYEYKLCNAANNANKCPTYPQISGKVFIDANNDGFYNPGEIVVPGVHIKDNSGLQGFTSASGVYEISSETLGRFEFAPQPMPYYNFTPASKSVNFETYREAETQDFAIVPKVSAEDVQSQLSQITIARPGFPLSFQVIITNNGTAGKLTNTSFQFPSEFVLDSITAGGSLNGGLIQWPSFNLNPFQQFTSRVYGHLLPSATLGSVLKFSVEANPLSSTDLDLSNNKSEVSAQVRGSFDPNDKSATPVISPLEIAAGAYIDYTIRFQNTGTDTAFTVVVTDTLPDNLDISSFKAGSASHNCNISLKGAIATFEFKKIHLLWAKENEPASHGYVSFKVKPVNGLISGDAVENKAYIYFDFNQPIITNVATTQVSNTVVTALEKENEVNQGVFIYPNPAFSRVMLSENGKAEIYTITGSRVLEAEVTDHSLDISSLSKGMYQLKFTSQSGASRTIKLLKE